MTEVKVKVTYLVVGANHSGYCSGAENEEFDSYYKTKFLVLNVPLADFVDGVLPEEKYPPGLVPIEKEGCLVKGGSGYCEGNAYKRSTPIKVELVSDSEFESVEKVRRERIEQKKLLLKKKKFEQNLKNAVSKLTNEISSLINSLFQENFDLALESTLEDSFTIRANFEVISKHNEYFSDIEVKFDGI